MEAMVGHNAEATTKIKDKLKSYSINHCIHRKNVSEDMLMLNNENNKIQIS